MSLALKYAPNWATFCMVTPPFGVCCARRRLSFTAAERACFGSSVKGSVERAAVIFVASPADSFGRPETRCRRFLVCCLTVWDQTSSDTKVRWLRRKASNSPRSCSSSRAMTRCYVSVLAACKADTITRASALHEHAASPAYMLAALQPSECRVCGSTAHGRSKSGLHRRACRRKPETDDSCLSCAPCTRN